MEDGEVVKHGDPIPATVDGCKRFVLRLVDSCQSRRPEKLIGFTALVVPI